MKPFTFQEILEATGLKARAVRKYLADLGILPVSMDGRLHLYPAAAVDQIREIRLESAIRRRTRRTRRQRRSSPRRRSGRIITLEEAKQLAKGKA